MATQSESSLIGLLEIPIVTSRTGPMRRLVADLDEQSQQANRARNAVVRAWLRWREDNPEWSAPQRLDAKGKPFPPSKTDFAPEVVAHDGTIGEWEAVPTGKTRKSTNRKTGETKEKAATQWHRKGDGVRGVGFGTWLYHKAGEAAPSLDGQIIMKLVSEVISNLQTKCPSNTNGHRWRWQAVLAFDDNAPRFLSREDTKNIPVPNQSSAICYEGLFTGKVSGETRKLVEYWGKSSAVLCFPLFAASHGRKQRCPIVTLKIGALSPGNRDVLKKVARGEFKFSDSKLVYKKERWQLQLTYRQPAEDLGLDKDRIAYIYPQFPEVAQPFLIDSEHAGKTWRCGSGKWLAAEFDQLDVRRIRLRGRYKVASSGVKGHGRKRFEMRLKPWAHKTHDCQRHFSWQFIAEVVRFCKRFNCGTVVYREPSLSIRDNLWLGAKGVPFDWTGLETDLKFKLRYYGINILTPSDKKSGIARINGKELRERFGGEKTPVVARKSQSVDVSGVMTIASNGSRFAKSRKRQPLANGAARS